MFRSFVPTSVAKQGVGTQDGHAGLKFFSDHQDEIRDSKSQVGGKRLQLVLILEGETK